MYEQMTTAQLELLLTSETNAYSARAISAADYRAQGDKTLARVWQQAAGKHSDNMTAILAILQTR
jgi:hypothetical protein